MLFEFTEEQKMMQRMVREFTENEIKPLDAVMDKEGFHHELWDKIKENGFLGVPFPEKYGGGDGDPITSAIVINRPGSASVALTLDAHWLAADTILYHGTEAKGKYPIEQLPIRFCLCLTGRSQL